MQRLIFLLSLGIGALITFVDSRPAWDDTGVTAGLLFIFAAVFGFFWPSRPWIWALNLGLWIPIWGIVVAHNFASILALLVSFAGAYLGSVVSKLKAPPDK